MDVVTVLFNATQAHFHQLYAGLEMLAEHGDIKLRYEYKANSFPADCTKVLFNDKVLIFDLGDTSSLRTDLYEECDFYYKRMLLKEDYKKHEKVHPFGLNYPVMYKNKYIKRLFLKDTKFIHYSLKYHPFLSKVLNLNDCINSIDYSKMHYPVTDNRNIVFKTRLWDPARNKQQWKKDERNVMNKQRIDFIRMLKEQNGDNFIGGIEADEFSEKECPDLLLPKGKSHKNYYLKELKTCGIGISNPGLERSIGWKFSEYIAHSMAIVSSPISEYQLLGTLNEGTHYLEYNSDEECVEKVAFLMNNKDAMNKMKRSNYSYYNDYIRPDVKMRKLFAKITN